MTPIYISESQFHDGFCNDQCAYLAASVLSVSTSRLLVTAEEQLEPPVPIVVNAVALHRYDMIRTNILGYQNESMVEDLPIACIESHGQ